MPEGAHPLGGWKGAPPVELDGLNWTLDFASKFLEIPEALLRETIKYTGLPPSGTLNMRGFRSQGRTPRAYNARDLIIISEDLASLKEKLQGNP
jgi:hypothetical protein